MTNCPACKRLLAMENLTVCLLCGHMNGHSQGVPVLCVAACTDGPEAEITECSKLAYIVIREGKLSLNVPKGFDPTYGEDDALKWTRGRIDYGRAALA